MTIQHDKTDAAETRRSGFAAYLIGRMLAPNDYGCDAEDCAPDDLCETCTLEMKADDTW